MANGDNCRMWSALTWGAVGAFALPMFILLAAGVIDPHGHIGDLTWTLVPGFLIGLSAYLLFRKKDSNKNDKKLPEDAKTGHQAIQSASNRDQSSGSIASTKQDQLSSPTTFSRIPNAVSSTDKHNLLQQIDECLDAKDADTIERLIAGSFVVQIGQQERAARLYVKAVNRIGLIGVGNILHRALGGTPDYTDKQEKVIESILPFLANSGLNPNMILNGKPLIHCAIEAANGSDCEDAVAPLIFRGADVNSVNDKGLSALGAHLAKGLISDDYRFDPYLSHGAVLNETDRLNGKIYLTIMRYGLDNILSMITDDDLRKLNDTTEYRDGVWLLIAAVQGNHFQSNDPIDSERQRVRYEQNSGHVKVVKRLLSYGVDPNKSIEPGRIPTAIELAMVLRHDSVVDVMLQYAR